MQKPITNEAPSKTVTEEGAVRILSPEARERIATAQRARGATQRASGPPPTSITPPLTRIRLSREEQKRIAEAHRKEDAARMLRERKLAISSWKTKDAFPQDVSMMVGEVRRKHPDRIPVASGWVRGDSVMFQSLKSYTHRGAEMFLRERDRKNHSSSLEKFREMKSRGGRPVITKIHTDEDCFAYGVVDWAD